MTNEPKHDELLRDQAFIILNNLKSFNSSPEMIDDIIRLLPNSELSLLLPIFELGREFYKNNNEFPAGRYFLSTDYANIFLCMKRTYSDDIYDNVINTLKRQQVSYKTIQQISEGNLETALSTLSEFNNIHSNKKERFDPSNHMDLYIEDKNKGLGIQSGIIELDEILNGYDYGTLNVVAAPASCGKTTFAVSTVYNAIMNENKNFIFFSLEIMDKHVYWNFISRHSLELGKPLIAADIKKAKLDIKKEQILAEVCEDFNKKIKDKLFIITQNDFERFNTASIEKIMHEYDAICQSRGEQLDGFAFDYLQLTKYYKPPAIRDEKETMNYYTRYFLELSTSFNGRGLVGILLSQVNRTGSEQLKKSKDASLFSFAEANELERSASTAIVLNATDDMKMAGSCNFHLVKNRIGETKVTPTTFFADYKYFKFGTGKRLTEFINEKTFDFDVFEKLLEIEI